MHFFVKNTGLKIIILLITTYIGIKEVDARVYSTCPYPQHEISFSYGYMSADQLSVKSKKANNALYKKAIVFRDYNNEKYTYIGPVAFNYKFFFKERLSIGFSLAYSHTGVSYTQGNISLKDKFHTISVIPRLDFYYIRNPKFAMYGLLGAGVAVVNANYADANSKKTNVTLGFQVTPLAVRIGRDFGLTIELGIGNLGLGNGGFSYRKYDRPWTGL